jgi:diguanylate cyclase (GGDEF)-like protein
MNGGETLTQQDLLSCLELGRALTAELSPQRPFQQILNKVSALLPAQNWSLLLMEEATEQLRFEVSVDLDLSQMAEIRLKLGEGVAGQCALRQETMIVPDVRQSDHFYDRVDALSGMTTTSLVCVPLIFGERCLGVLEVVNPRSLDARTPALLEIIAEYAAVAVENTRQYERIKDLSIRDNLTGLYNTRHLYENLAGLVEEYAALNEPFSLVFMDVDNFKHVVDTYGHLNGSQALREIAHAIRGTLAEPAYGVSYGGDEFVVVLPGFGKSRAVGKADEIRAHMRRTTYLSSSGHSVSIQGSFGVATFPEDANDSEGLLALADQAMFDVKACGRNAIKSA